MRRLQGHGTAACARRGCEREDCQQALYLQRKLTKLRISRGQYVISVPIRAARGVMRTQMSANTLGRSEMARASGLRELVLWRIETLQQEFVTTMTMARLQTLPHLHELRRTFLPIKATRLRSEALAVAGWGALDVGLALGQKHPISWAKHQLVVRERAEKILALTDELVRQPGPTPRAAQIARTQGWLAWDAYDQDDFWDAEWSGEGGVIARLAGEALVQEYQWLLDAGSTPAEAARRLGVAQRSVAATRGNLGYRVARQESSVQ